VSAEADRWPEGARVRYVPTHAGGNSAHPDCEEGVVARGSEKRDRVFVRFAGSPDAKAVYVWNLERL
jgi:hypothetical protein